MSDRPSGLTCREFVEFLNSYLEKELPSEQDLAFRHHMTGCSSCVAYLETYKETIQIGRMACAAEDSPLPADVPDTLVKAILAARKTSSPD